MLATLAQRVTAHPFFARPGQERSAWQTILWWEKRRIPYNLLVGAAGILDLLILVGCEVLVERVQNVPAGPMPDPRLFVIVGIFFYGVAANLCYTLGWVAELVAKRFWGSQATVFASISFTLGLAFSIALTLLPGAGVIVLTIVGLIAGPQFWGSI